MLQPSHFEVNEAWIAFKLNDTPLRTTTDGDFDFFAVMDAANRFILGSATVSTSAEQRLEKEARQLLEEAQAHRDELPKTLLMPTDAGAEWLALEAQTQGITVVEVPVDQLLMIIGHAREAFRERFGRGPALP